MIAALIILLIALVIICFYFVKLNNERKDYLKEFKKAQKQDKKLHDELSETEETYRNLSHQLMELETTNHEKTREVDLQIARAAELSRQIEDLNSQKLALRAELEYNNNQIKEFSKFLQERKDNLNTEFEREYEKVRESYLQKIEDYEVQLNDERKKRNASILHLIDEEKEKAEEDFFKLQITDNELEDIRILNTVRTKLNNQLAVGKIIYKLYIEKHYKELINRVLKNEDITGIYKITNTVDGRCYVGQAVKIGERWKSHIKRAIGAETPIKNKLYPAMEKEGIEHFTFQVIDICDKNQLNEREQYWQDFYGAKIYGYSMK